MLLSKNKKIISNFRLEKVPYVELWRKDVRILRVTKGADTVCLAVCTGDAEDVHPKQGLR